MGKYDDEIKWILKWIKNRGQIAVRALENTFYMHCISCTMQKLHRKHEDKSGNQYNICEQCGAHN